jgi:hypothetical protein
MKMKSKKADITLEGFSEVVLWLFFLALLIFGLIYLAKRVGWL